MKTPIASLSLLAACLFFGTTVSFAEFIEGKIASIDLKARAVTVHRTGGDVTLSYRDSVEVTFNSAKSSIQELKPAMRVKVESNEPGVATRVAATVPVESVFIINVNAATSEQLQAIPRVGPALAAAIIKGRPYRKPDDLLNVSGIKEKMLERLTPYLKFD